MSLSFDAIAQQFDDQRGLPVTALRSLVACIDRHGGGNPCSIIEPGVGTGRIALPLAAAGHRVLGVDVFREMLEACRVKAEALRIGDRIELVCGDATALPRGDGSFDIGMFASLLYLVPDWERVLDEMGRVVRPDGVVMCLRERTEEGEALRLWDTAWRTRVEAAGYAHTSISPTDKEIIAAMTQRWGEPSIDALSSWTFGQTVAEGREHYGERLRSLYPDIPDVGWDALVDNFLSWSEESFPDPETRLGGTVTLEAIVSRL